MIDGGRKKTKTKVPRSLGAVFHDKSVAFSRLSDKVQFNPPVFLS